MASPSVVIDIAAEFVGKNAFDKAGKSTLNLEKNVKKLASALGVTFSTRAIVNFSKASVKAFAEDDAAITVLSNNLKNLGLAYQSVNAENFISKLEEQSGILDDSLRPAYAKLSKVTVSTTKTQELMALAVDLARANGLEFSAVINTLSRAYVGNYKGLKQLNTGLTDAELATKDFAEIQAILIKQSQGAGKAYIETFAGSIDKLSVASANAKEVIGEGLVDLFADMAGNGDINTATANVNKFATAVSGLLKDVSEYNLADFVSAFVTGNITESTASKLVKRPSARRFFTGGSGVSSEVLAARKAAAAAAAKLKAEKAAAAAKIAADKKAAANKAILAKAESIFNMDQIQIEAALKGKISADEKLRLELQRAILNEDFDLADKLQKKLEASQKATAALQGQINAIKPAYDPFEEWIKSLKEIGETLTKILGMPVNTSSSMLNPNQPIVAQQDPNSTIQPKTNVDPIPVVVIPDPSTPVMPTTNMPTPTPGGFGFSLPSYITSGANFAGGAYTPPAPAPITIIVEGSILDGDDFSEIVNKATLNAYRRGLSQLPAGALP
jgi:hypothetical protein